MKHLLKLLIATFAASQAGQSIAAAVEYDTTEIVASVTGLGTAAIAIMGAGIVVAITVMIYRKIRGLASKG